MRVPASGDVGAQTPLRNLGAKRLKPRCSRMVVWAFWWRNTSITSGYDFWNVHKILCGWLRYLYSFDQFINLLSLLFIYYLLFIYLFICLFAYYFWFIVFMIYYLFIFLNLRKTRIGKKLKKLRKNEEANVPCGTLTLSFTIYYLLFIYLFIIN